MGIGLQIDMGVTLMLGEKLYTQHKGLVFLRETVQNALDAGATLISINGQRYGSDGFELSVRDNGVGIADLQAFFLTLGGSHKELPSAIGGYGIAKLAIIGMDDWTISSLEGTITRDMLLSGSDIATSSPTQGCMVWSKDKKSWWDMDKDIVQFLRHSDFSPDVRVTYNGQAILPFELEEIAPGVYKTNEVGCKERNMVVRNQGLVQFYSPIYTFDEVVPAYVYDVFPTCTPYDPEYPFSANRESLLGSVHAEFQSVKAQLTKNHDNNYQAAQAIKGAVEIAPCGFVYGKGFTEEDVETYKELIAEWRRMVVNVLRIIGDQSVYAYGISNFGDEEACYVRASKAFCINPKSIRASKSNMLAVAIHEVAHIDHPDHYDAYANEATRITGKVLEAILDGTFIP